MPKEKGRSLPKLAGARLLRDFPYTSLDCVAGTEWIAGPVSQCKGSDTVERANFDALCDLLDSADPNGGDWEIIRFSHFGVEWIDLVFARPSSNAAMALGAAREMLEICPILDEVLLTQYEKESNA